MYRIYMTCAIVVVLALTSSLCLAQTSRYMALGGAGIALADDSGAIDLNPAGLGQLDIGLGDVMGMKPWNFEASATTDIDGDMELHSLNIAGTSTGSSLGVGGRYTDYDGDDDTWAVGFGNAVVSSDMSWGVSVLDDGADTSFNAGGMWNLPDVLVDFRAGAVARDITGESADGPYFDVGASAGLGGLGTVAVDLLDITDESNSDFRAGIEYPLALGFTIRGGIQDRGLMSAGAGFELGTLHVDAAWMEAEGDADDSIFLTATGGF
ncbi:MAG: hypothetical protein ACLFWB_03645 [Armatimonadota bacterium]